jgi:hypothetical protein
VPTLKNTVISVTPLLEPHRVHVGHGTCSSSAFQRLATAYGTPRHWRQCTQPSPLKGGTMSGNCVGSVTRDACLSSTHQPTSDRMGPANEDVNIWVGWGKGPSC